MTKSKIKPNNQPKSNLQWNEDAIWTEIVKKWEDLGHRQACCVLGFMVVADKEDERRNGKGCVWEKPMLWTFDHAATQPTHQTPCGMCVGLAYINLALNILIFLNIFILIYFLKYCARRVNFLTNPFDRIMYF